MKTPSSTHSLCGRVGVCVCALSYCIRFIRRPLSTHSFFAWLAWVVHTCWCRAHRVCRCACGCVCAWSRISIAPFFRSSTHTVYVCV